MPASPFSLYIHLPWCIRKCPYCDFNSHALKDELPEEDYITALLADLDQELPWIAHRTLNTVFFGGGTPSLFSAHGIARILEGVKTRIVCDPDWEVTLEANPGSVEHGRFSEYRQAGINRISLGVQSFDNNALTSLGRIHDARQAQFAIEELHTAGLDNFNIDLMFGLPTQTGIQNEAQAVADIKQAIAANPAHISHYELTLESNTAFAARPPSRPDDDARWAMQNACQAQLTKSGFEHYEVSAYARAGRECRHNLNYWRYGDYLGIGAGAHGKLRLSSGNHYRYWKTKHPRAYLAQAALPTRITGQQTIPPEERLFEFMLNNLRLKTGFTAADFVHATELPLQNAMPQLMNASKQGLMEESQRRWQTTQTGWQHLNTVQTLFLPE